MGFSCKFSLKPIHWTIKRPGIWLFFFDLPDPIPNISTDGCRRCEGWVWSPVSSLTTRRVWRCQGEWGRFFWHLNGENMGQDHIILIWKSIWKIISYQFILWYFCVNVWSYWILGAHGHMALQIVLLSVSCFFLPCFFINHILWSDVDDAFSWACFVFSQKIPRGMDLAGHAGFDQQPALGKVLGSAGRLKRSDGSWDPIRPLDPVGSTSQGRNRHPFHKKRLHLLHRLRYEWNLIWHV